METSTHNFSALTTDLYEVTMACGYCKAGVGRDRISPLRRVITVARK